MPERLAAPALALLLVACAASGPQAELFGRTWRLAGIEGAPAAAPGRSTLLVTPDGTVAGDGGCNRYSGKAEVEDDAVTFGPLLATKRACEPDVTRQEVRLFEGLRRAAAWRIEGGELTLRDAEGRELLRFSI
jgi:heat shock protein HslJ